MTQLSPTRNRRKLEQNEEKEDQIIHATSATNTHDVSRQDQEEEEKEPMVTPTGTCYLPKFGEYSPDDIKLPLRVQSTNSLLGLVGLEGHEESEEEFSTTGISAVTEEQEVMDIVVSPTTPASPSEDHEFDDATFNTTPPGSVQEPGLFSLSPPRLTTYSVGSVTSASVTESFVLQPRPIQSSQRHNHLPQESPRLSRSPLVQQPQLQPQPQPRSRPPRAPHHHSAIPGGNNSVGGGPSLVPRAVIGTGPDPSSLSGAGASGSGHRRTPTDGTNYSFLSSLTEISGGEYIAPRRRTLSWDNNANSQRGGAPATESMSLGGPSTPGSILQPILLPDDLESPARPPMSISASNLRRVLPAVPGRTATTPTRSSSSRKASTKLLLAPSSLPSRENLHPLIQKLQNVSHSKSTPFIQFTPPSKDENNLMALHEKLEDSSPSKHTASTSATSPFTAHLQDEKKDDDSSRSHQIMQQKSYQDRKSGDYASFSSSTTIRLQKTGNTRGAFERQMASPQRISESGATRRFDLGDVLEATKECNVETEIVEGIERNNLVDKGNKNHSNDVSSLSDWPYFLLAWGLFNLGGRGFVLNAGTDARNIFLCDRFLQFCLGLGVATFIKRKLSKTFLDMQVMGHYRDELLILRNIWVVLDKIVALSTMEEKDNSDATTKSIIRFRSGGQRIDDIMDWNASSSFGGLEATREDFIESAQIAYEGLARRDGETELTFESLREMAKLPNGTIDRPKVKILSELFCPSRQGRVSKYDFVKSTDRIFKTTTLLIAKTNNASQIYHAVDNIVDGIFYTIAFILAPSVFGTNINTLILSLLVISVNFTFMVCFMSAENLKGIIRLMTQKSYDIGDRVYFIKPEDTETKIENGPPSGGWVVERIDLFKTTLRQGITGERSTFSNGCALLTNSRVVNWKRSHGANVTLSMEFSEKTGSNQIYFFQRQISEWIEDRPHEWFHLDSFRMVDVDIHQHRVTYEVVLRHRESWHNYAAVQDSKSDILVFLHELRSSVDA